MPGTEAAREETVRKGLSVTPISELFRMRDHLQELNGYALTKVMIPQATTMLSMVEKAIKERSEGC